jgi:serine phosphatase RsbU (regulator of sigma subunit)
MFMFLIIPLSIAVMIGIMYDLSKTVEHLTRDLVKRTIEKVEIELGDVVAPVVDDLNLVRETSIAFDFDLHNIDKFNHFMRPLIANNQNIRSGLFSNSHGDEFMLLQKSDSVWINRITFNPTDGPKTVKYSEFHLNKKLGLDWQRTWIDSSLLDNDPRRKVWYKKAMQSPPLTNAWTRPYIFMTTKEPGISVATHWKNFRDTTEDLVISFDILMTDIIHYMNELKISENGHSVLFSDQEHIICQSNHVKFSCTDSVKKYSLAKHSTIGMPVFEAMIKEISLNDIPSGVPFHFKYDGNRWWAEVVSYNAYGIRNMKVAVLVPESDFMSEMNRTKLIVILGFLLVFFLTLISINAYRKQQKANVLLNQKNREIAQQKEKIEKQHLIVREQRDQIREIHSEVTKSIAYAQRIQSSALPNQDILSDNVKDCFVLFKPRDVVSGDFYYFIEKENKLVVVVSDCTGHGVPGAFMSMLGMSMLDNIILSDCKMEPDIILNRLRKFIIHALGQSQVGDGQRDGMDMSVCIFDLETKKMKFAGANNSIIILSKNHSEWAERKEIKHMQSVDTGVNLFRVKADSMPISIYLKMDNFTSREFQLEEGDQVFMYSDGYIDQFGGAAEAIRAAGGKKFKIKAFQNLLLENAHLSAAEQRVILEKTLNEWRGNIKQIDDITVIGFRV